MPIESVLLGQYPNPLSCCPKCEAYPFVPFMRGQVQRAKRRWWWPFVERQYCALICRRCKDVVGWESPSDFPRWLHAKGNEDVLAKYVRTGKMPVWGSE